MWQAEAFWQFSLAWYEKVKPSCLLLQDKHGFNINLLLLCLYLQQQNAGLSDQQLESLLHSLSDTEIRLQPLRAVRRSVKALDMQAYRYLLDAELRLEKRQQQDLIACLNQLGPLQAPADNLMHYARLIKLDDRPDVMPLIATLYQSVAEFGLPYFGK
ncbi:hypothetical protein GCM10009092_05120 [Bowmanella denitrificans]|uniref:TIGR02444 family protein n=1 Tax=Bowmanella denitrificans TaxID=366582 RepID=A0ABN0WPJ8_9ALTE|nr:TIGR02444 family protein [Bowmanella denitrificans]